VRLDRLIDGLETRSVGPADPGTVEVTAIVHDSREVTPGALYCCVRGERVDGHQFAPAAVQAGAVALLCEHMVDAAAEQIVVPSTRQAMPPVAATFFGHPADRLTVVGVTGTNGKTTTTFTLAAICQAQGWPTGVLGTLSGVRTTPEAPELQASLARFVIEGMRAVTMEVSSHALVQHRADAIGFAAAVFTNLSQDHLDYHRNMEEYFAAKARLFEPGRSRIRVINRDDPWGERLLATYPDALTFGLSDAARRQIGPRSSRFVWRGVEMRLPVGGEFNVVNALAAATTAEALGIDASVVAEGLSTLAPIPGRYEAVDAGQDFAVVVDYAHTPDGLQQLLTSARATLAPGARAILVFGCGGDRDRAKRPLMGDVATRLADVAVVTSDNPRHEDPSDIIAEIESGVAADQRAKLTVEPDRAAAIRMAIGGARSGDVVLIAGKGHEMTQEVADTVVPFDDRDQARRAIESLGGPLGTRVGGDGR
jgi:UDP-N-acetylmuramoyl-L-alanyl-D-glutamate--2,6-diaminopimelate ligase